MELTDDDLKAINMQMQDVIDSYQYIQFTSRAEMYQKIDGFKVEEGKKYTILFEEVE